MVQSLNKKVDLVMDSTAFTGVSDYGKVMIGDKSFEFYNSRDPRKYIQIPWEEVDCVIVSLSRINISEHTIPRSIGYLKKRKKYLEPLEIMLEQRI